MKAWLTSVFEAAAGSNTARGEARQAADIVLAYIDGETLNLINGRAVPGEDLQGRVVTNAVRLIEMLSGARLGRAERSAPPDPALIFGA